MKNNKWLDLTNGVCWSMIFSIAALIMSIISLAHKYPRSYREGSLGFDYLGVIVGILALLVTFLVAWQIWQTIDSKRAIRDVFVMRTQFNDLRREIDTLHGMHEAFMLDIYGHDNRRKGQSCAAFDYFMRSAFIYMLDMKHYDNWFMSALSSMKTCYEDIYRPTMGPRDREKNQFIQRKEEYISYLESLLRQARGINRFSQQAEAEINFLIESLRKLKPRKDDFDEEKNN